jgi:hypothetical protein
VVALPGGSLVFGAAGLAEGFDDGLDGGGAFGGEVAADPPRRRWSRSANNYQSGACDYPPFDVSTRLIQPTIVAITAGSTWPAFW